MYDFLKDKTALYVEDELDVLKNISERLSNFFGHSIQHQMVNLDMKCF